MNVITISAQNVLQEHMRRQDLVSVRTVRGALIQLQGPQNVKPVLQDKNRIQPIQSAKKIVLKTLLVQGTQIILYAILVIIKYRVQLAQNAPRGITVLATIKNIKVKQDQSVRLPVQKEKN